MSGQIRDMNMIRHESCHRGSGFRRHPDVRFCLGLGSHHKTRLAPKLRACQKPEEIDIKGTDLEKVMVKFMPPGLCEVQGCFDNVDVYSHGGCVSLCFA